MKQKYGVLGVLLVIEMLVVPASASASSWEGTYGGYSEHHSVSFVKRLTVTDEKNGKFKVRATLSRFPSDSVRKEVSMEAEAHAFQNCNTKGIPDTLIADFVDAKYKPVMLIKRGPPWSSVPNAKQRYKYVSYTCYMVDDKWHWYIDGSVFREAGSR